MLVERVAVLALAVGLCSVALLVWRCCLQRRLRQMSQIDAPAAVQQMVNSLPAILYFTAPHCAQYRFQQAPILEHLAQRAEVAIYAIDAVAQQELARFYGVMTVPSTVILDGQLRPAAVNHGLATRDTLDRQIASMAK